VPSESEGGYMIDDMGIFRTTLAVSALATPSYSVLTASKGSTFELILREKNLCRLVRFPSRRPREVREPTQLVQA
jgi:hypothetical protein